MSANPYSDWLRTHFLDYQARYLLDDAPVVLVNKGRQLGISDASAGKIVRRGLFARRPQIFISASQRLADELIQTVRTHCEVLAALGCRAATNYTVANSEELRWASGGRLLALSSSARTGRSFHGDLYFDEFAFHERPEAIWKAAAPMASREGWQINVVSTPNGAQGLFYQWCEVETPGGWSRHTIPLERALGDGLNVDRRKLLSLVGDDERMFAEAYQCVFLDGNLQYIPTALADRALAWPGELPTLDEWDPNGAEPVELHAGLDVGRHHDLTVLTVAARAAGYVYVVAQLCCKRTAFREQKALVRKARRAFGWKTLHVDANGLGTQLCEEFEAAWGSGEVVGLAFTAQDKEELASRALRWLRDERLRIAKTADGKRLRNDIIAVRRVVTDRGHISYEVPRTSAGHGDRFWSMALALKGAGEPPQPRGYGQQPLLWVN